MNSPGLRLAGLAERRSASSIALLAISIASYTLILFQSRFSPRLVQEIGGGGRILAILVVLSALNIVFMFLVELRGTFRVLLVIHAALFIVFKNYFPDIFAVEVLLAVLLILPIAIYEAFPANLGISALFLLFSTVVRKEFVAPSWEGMPYDFLFEQLDFVVCASIFAVAVCLLTHHREGKIRLLGEVRRLETAVSELSRANLSFQDYARRAEERSRAEERRRLTRDIHDITGYTLTNSIMMLEAAKLASRIEPDKIPELIEKARTNAEEGLRQIREVIHNMRRNDTPGSSGLEAIRKLVRVFSLATEVEVRLELGNVVWSFDETIDELLYHFIQEGMLNAFRHGRASEVVVLFWRSGPDLLVTIRDDGRGASVVREGLGITGMRERLEAVGGSLAYRSGPDGFGIRMTVPIGAHEIGTSWRGAEHGGAAESTDTPRGRPDSVRREPQIRA